MLYSKNQYFNKGMIIILLLTQGEKKKDFCTTMYCYFKNPCKFVKNLQGESTKKL